MTGLLKDLGDIGGIMGKLPCGSVTRVELPRSTGNLPEAANYRNQFRKQTMESDLGYNITGM